MLTSIKSLFSTFLALFLGLLVLLLNITYLII